MRFINNTRFLFFVLFCASFLLVSQAGAANPIAKVSAFEGEAFIMSGLKVVNITRLGQEVYHNDRVVTRQGEVEITFEDGAILKVQPQGAAQIQEQEEQSGFWFFKARKVVRRLTCFVGKLWFKSGTRKENYLQTPTAVAGLRGSEAYFGFDNAKSLLDVIYGEIFSTAGRFSTGSFDNPGVNAAIGSPVYNAALAAAAQSTSPDPAEAELAALEAIKAVADGMINNPDPNVAAEAQELSAATQSMINEKKGVVTPRKPAVIYPTTTTTTTTVYGG